jgi:hypothetical protein
MARKRGLIFPIIFPLLFLECSLSAKDTCTCKQYWGRCNVGIGEEGEKGCGGGHSRKKGDNSSKVGKSCAEQCEGNLIWKKLYQSSVDQQIKFENECKSPEGPTAKWGPNKAGSMGPFAIAFAGGLRNFAATWHSWQTNLIEPSGGRNYDGTSSGEGTLFDLYFHVWHDEKMNKGSVIRDMGIELAQSLPYTKAYVHESYRDYISLLNKDEPDFDGNVNTNTSWLEPIISEFNPHDGRLRHPYILGPGYSQFRKVYLVMQLIKNSMVQYSLIIRARPDHLFITPVDLRDLVSDFALRPKVTNANGHFIIIPERHQGQRISDHFALGNDPM